MRRRVGSACIPEKVGSSWSHPRWGAHVAVRYEGRLHGEERQMASTCYIRGGESIFQGMSLVMSICVYVGSSCSIGLPVYGNHCIFNCDWNDVSVHFNVSKPIFSPFKIGNIVLHMGFRKYCVCIFS